MKTKARNAAIHSFQILFDVSKFNSVFELISQVSCQDLPTNKKKQPQPDYKQTSAGLQRKKIWNSWVTLVYLIWFYNCFTAEWIFTIYSHLFYYLLQQGQVGIPRTLLIPVRASGTLVTLKETGGTGSTLRTVETRWTFTATWQLTEVRSDLEKLKLL